MPGIKDLIGSVKFLTREEEREHFRRWREEGCEESRLALLRSVSPLAIKQAFKFCKRRGILRDIEEYESLAFDGVLRAMEKWNPELGNRLATYTVPWCFQRMQRAYTQDRIIRCPVVAGNHERSAELARSTVSLSANEEEYGENAALLVDWNPANEVADLDQLAHDKRRMWAALQKLAPRDRQIVIARVFDELTLEKVGSQLGITKERVRQIETRALNKLREYMNTTHPIDESQFFPATNERPDPVSLLDSIQQISPGEIESSIRKLQREKESFDENYKRRLGLLKTLQKATGSPPRPRQTHRATDDSFDDLRKAIGELGSPSAAELGAKLGCLPRVAALRASALVRRGQATKGEDGRFSLVA